MEYDKMEVKWSLLGTFEQNCVTKLELDWDWSLSIENT